MSDNPAEITRRARQVRIPFVLVPAGAHPDPHVITTIGQPARLRVRMEPGRQAAATSPDTHRPTAPVQPQAAPPAPRSRRGRPPDPYVPARPDAGPAVAPVRGLGTPQPPRQSGTLTRQDTPETGAAQEEAQPADPVALDRNADGANL